MGLPIVAASAPSSRLPPIRQIQEQPIDVLANLVGYLNVLYNAPVRGARRIDRKTARNGSGLAAQGDDEASLDVLRADKFEKAHTIRWLTALVSRSSLLPTPPEDADTTSGNEDKVDALIRSATSLIALCGGTSAARTLTRRYAFYAPSLHTDIDISLTDVPISVESDSATVGTQTWGGAYLLAEMLVEDPAKFGLDGPGRGGDVRILELGAGTGLVSLAAARFLALRRGCGGAHATLVASDYHPAVLANLAHNVRVNFPPGTLPPGLRLSTHALDWSAYGDNDALSGGAGARGGAAAPAFDEPFDVILGADIIYEPEHASWIRDTVSALLPRPAPAQAASPRFHLVMPLRPTHTFETRMVEETFPLACCSPARPGPDLALCVLEKETIVCEAEDAQDSEVEYVHYLIGWA